MAKAPIRIGFIGVGGIARHHLNLLKSIEGVTVTALCDIAPEAIAKAKEQFPALEGAFVTDDYRALLARDDVDAVEICTPHTLHTQMTLDAMDAHKHILLEKPMVCRVEDAHVVLKKAEGYDKVFALAYQRHSQGIFRYIKSRIASGEVGEVQFISALQCQQWRKNTYGKWRQDPALSGGGQINDSGSHLLDILLWTTGLTVAEVSAFMDNMDTPVDINSALSMRFTNGAQGNISVVGDSPIWCEDITIWCEKAVFFVRGGKLDVSDADGKRRTIDEAEMPEGSNIDENFIGAIRDEAEVGAPPICGLRTIELTEAAWRSAAQNGVPVKMN